MNLLLALDIGTTSVKVGLYQPDGCCLAIAMQEYELISYSAEQAELDPNTYWLATVKTIREVIAQAKVDPVEVRGLAVSSQGETTIVLDAEGKPLRNALVWLDNRAVQQAEELNVELGESVYEKTGIPEVLATWPACKILWIKQNEPQVFARAARFLLVQDFLIQRLCGNYVTDGSISCTTMYYDIVAHQWWKIGRAHV